MDIGHIPTEIFAGTVIGLPVFWLFIKRTISKSAAETTLAMSESAKVNVIELLREEIQRMSEINGKLADGLNELQIENVKLRREISVLHDTINTMTEQFGIISRRYDLSLVPSSTVEPEVLP